MFNLGGKKIYRTLIMDNTNKYVVGRISGIQKALTKSEEHFAPHTYEDSSITVLRVEATKKEYKKIQKRVEELYPGLCIFDAPIKVAC